MSRDNFLRGALILTIAGIAVKVIGAGNRIFLSRLLGGEGIGLYQMAYPIYLLALNISYAGIPIAISIVVAERVALRDRIGVQRVFRLSLLLMVVTGLVFSGLLYFSASWLIAEGFVQDPRAYMAIVALAPAIVFVTVLASFRGYFQGLQQMFPSGVSQVAEQFVRVCAMVVFAWILLPKGIEYGAAGATFGAFPGALAGILVLLYFFAKKPLDKILPPHAVEEVKQPPQVWTILRRIFWLALPVSIASIMLPLGAIIDLLIVPKRLVDVGGHSIPAATELYGYLTGMAVPLINLATILTASLAASIVPAVSEAFTLGKNEVIRSRLATAVRVSSLITIPGFFGLAVLAGPISKLLYGTWEAGPAIGGMALGVFFLGLHQITTAGLQGLGRTTIPVINMVFAALCKVGLNWVLTGTWGVVGASWASVADYAIAALLNLYFVYRFVGYRIALGDLWRPIFASILMSLAVYPLYFLFLGQLESNTLATLIAMAMGGVVYGVVLLLVGGVRRQDLERVPAVGKRLIRVLEKIKLIR